MLHRPFKYTLAMLILPLFAGCHTQDVGQVGERPREAITYAARAKYPGNAQDSPRVRAVAIVDADGKLLEGKTIDVYNLGNESIPATAIWVNGAFVKQIGPISPKGHVTVKCVELLEAGPSAKSMTELERTVQKVELQTPDGLYNVQGPVNR
jgi:hypothetical protein